MTQRQSQYDKGYHEGWADRSKETFSRNHVYWNLEDHFSYTLATIIAITLLYFLFWLSGIYIRWQVGPIPFDPNESPIKAAKEGWNYSCVPSEAYKAQWNWTCNFRRDHP